MSIIEETKTFILGLVIRAGLFLNIGSCLRRTVKKFTDASLRRFDEIAREANMATMDNRLSAIQKIRRVYWRANYVLKTDDDMFEYALAPIRERVKRDLETIGKTDHVFFEDARERVRSGTLRGDTLFDWLKETNDRVWNKRVFLEQLLGFDLLLRYPGPMARNPDFVFFEPTQARHLFLVCDFVRRREGVFYDLGSGRGDVAILVSLVSNMRAKGVELQSALVEEARARARELASNAEFITADVRDIDIADGDVFYLYNSFVGDILRTIIGRIRGIAERKHITMILTNPQPVWGRLSWLMKDEKLSESGFTVYENKTTLK